MTGFEVGIIIAFSFLGGLVVGMFLGASAEQREAAQRAKLAIQLRERMIVIRDKPVTLSSEFGQAVFDLHNREKQEQSGG